jgi:hypothetical protein
MSSHFSRRYKVALAATSRQGMGAVFKAAPAEALPVLLASDLARIEGRLRQVGRAVCGTARPMSIARLVFRATRLVR